MKHKNKYKLPADVWVYPLVVNCIFPSPDTSKQPRKAILIKMNQEKDNRGVVVWEDSGFFDEVYMCCVSFKEPEKEKEAYDGLMKLVDKEIEKSKFYIRSAIRASTENLRYKTEGKIAALEQRLYDFFVKKQIQVGHMNRYFNSRFFQPSGRVVLSGFTGDNLEADCNENSVVAYVVETDIKDLGIIKHDTSVPVLNRRL